ARLRPEYGSTGQAFGWTATGMVALRALRASGLEVSEADGPAFAARSEVLASGVAAVRGVADVVRDELYVGADRARTVDAALGVRGDWGGGAGATAERARARLLESARRGARPAGEATARTPVTARHPALVWFRDHLAEWLRPAE